MGAEKAKAYVCVYVHEEVNAHLWSSGAKPAAFRLGGGTGRSAFESSSTRTSSCFSLPTGASSESELDSTGAILVFFVEVGFLG